ncbi:MAG: Gfo/Idh/MocA family oxidoreductase [Lentisphaerae bacterium]|nr:Gfo/Idh/MocA family oxidoreductase [Lentisphaerota bacterium]
MSPRAPKPPVTRPVFQTSRRIRLGVWGLGRGADYYRSCRALNIDVVAGCDFNPHMRERFLAANPGAFVTGEAREFLARDVDAVLVATYCPAHAADAIACLEAGKHVLSEVTAFHTMAEGVRLVEAVERSGRVYNLAENYPFTAATMWLKRKWDDGLFGDLMYAESEYLHEVLALSYTYIDGAPIVPGWQAHSWRSWIDYHYYNTHSLGPVMYVTGVRPTRVVALPGGQRLPGYLGHGMGGIAPSLINLSNGAVMRNLMGATTNDGACRRLWGTQGSAQMLGQGLELRLGGRGDSPLFRVQPQWDSLGTLAAQTGHSGGDFWVLYYFARQILEGTPAPFDVYTAADCTIPGILAYRSQMEGGTPHEVPDFRLPAERERYRTDDVRQPPYDYREGLFPASADRKLTGTFTSTMRDLIATTATFRACRDWTRVADDVEDPARLLVLADQAIAGMPKLLATQQAARRIADHYPESDGARVLQDLLTLGEADLAADRTRVAELERVRRQLLARVRQVRKVEAQQKRRAGLFSPFVTAWRLSALTPKRGDVRHAPCARLSDRRLRWTSIEDASPTTDAAHGFINVHALYPTEDGIAYLGGRFKVATAGWWTLCLGHDGGCRMFVDGRDVLCRPTRENPARRDRSTVTVRLAAGVREIVIALDTAAGLGWGIYFRFRLPPKRQRRATSSLFPTPVGAT